MEIPAKAVEDPSYTVRMAIAAALLAHRDARPGDVRMPVHRGMVTVRERAVTIDARLYLLPESPAIGIVQSRTRTLYPMDVRTFLAHALRNLPYGSAEELASLFTRA